MGELMAIGEPEADWLGEIAGRPGDARIASLPGATAAPEPTRPHV